MRISRLLILILPFLISSVIAADTPAAVGPGEIAGTITDEAGFPLEGVLVDAWTWYKGNEARTDKSGHFRLSGLGDNKTVELRISRDGLSPWYQENQPTGVSDLNVALNDKTYFEGTVLTPDGRPLSHALVRADSGPKQNQHVLITHVWTETAADGQGHYKLMVSPDNYRLEVYDGTAGIAWIKATAVADQATPQDLHLEEGLQLTVDCVDDSDQKPIPGVHLSVSDHKQIKATSDADGKAVFKHLPSDALEFNIKSDTHMRWWMAEAKDDRQHDLKTNDQWSYDGPVLDLSTLTGPVTLHMQRGAVFSGHVVDPDGNPVKDAIVVTNRPGYTDSIDGTQRFTAHTNAEGVFKLTVPANDEPINLIAHDGNYGHTRQWANGVTDALSADSGSTHEDLTLRLNHPGEIKGQIVSPTGEPIAGKQVRAIGADDRDSRYVSPVATTDGQGNFDLDFVRPGSVLVQIEPFWIHKTSGQTPPITSQQVMVNADETVENLKVTAKQ